MDRRQISAFLAVADALNFGRAADALGIRQSAVSQAIRRLEVELGFPLFERSSHHVALTAAGTELLGPARRALAAHHALDDAAAALARGTTGRLRIATTDGIGPSLTALLAAFRAERPAVQPELVVRSTAEKIGALRAGELDLAFVRSLVDAPPGLRAEVAWTEPVLAVLPGPQAGPPGQPVDLDALAALPFIVVPASENRPMHDHLIGLCRQAGIEPTLGSPLTGLQEALALIGTGAGWMLVPASNAPAAAPGTAVRSLPAPAPRTATRLLWRPAGLSPHAAAFLRLAEVQRDDGLLPAA